MLLMRQGEQAWLLTGEAGKHEFARVFFCPPKPGQPAGYIVRDGTPRVGGGIDLVGLAVTPAGADLTWSSGHASHIPREYFQYSFRP